MLTKNANPYKSYHVTAVGLQSGGVASPFPECLTCWGFKEAETRVMQWKIGNFPDDHKISKFTPGIAPAWVGWNCG